MGLCKCPKRQVTNQFCFEHRVNVCEHCMVQSHPKCIVQSYLQWLRDSDYVSNCTLCCTNLENGECVRLICYHVFHWDCLNARQTSLPANITPRGHMCSICDTEIFPNSNLVSPVAEALKKYLSTVNWGRNGLGLALISEGTAVSKKTSEANLQLLPATVSAVNKGHSSTMERSNSNNLDGLHSMLLIDAFNLPSFSEVHASSRRPMLPRKSPMDESDPDESKYRRRTPTYLLSRWARRFYAPSSRPLWRRAWLVLLSSIILFVVIIYVMAVLGRKTSNNVDDDWNNPNPQPNSHYE